MRNGLLSIGEAKADPFYILLISRSAFVIDWILVLLLCETLLGVQLYSPVLVLLRQLHQARSASLA